MDLKSPVMVVMMVMVMVMVVMMVVMMTMIKVVMMTMIKLTTIVVKSTLTGEQPPWKDSRRGDKDGASVNDTLNPDDDGDSEVFKYNA